MSRAGAPIDWDAGEQFARAMSNVESLVLVPRSSAAVAAEVCRALADEIVGRCHSDENIALGDELYRVAADLTSGALR